MWLLRCSAENEANLIMWLTVQDSRLCNFQAEYLGVRAMLPNYAEYARSFEE